MSEQDANGRQDKGEAREEKMVDLEVLHGEDVRGGADRRGDDGPEESITFVYGKM
jgi:hypothetical protein